jgi:hypothetical protein
MTFKQDGIDLAHRVYFTLAQRHDEQARRNSKAIALLVKLLDEKNLITPNEVDTMLTTITRWEL